jgi:signal transduction histidine kinase
MLERIQQAFREREASEERVRRFAADASHELRTPLTSIIGYSEMLVEGIAGPLEGEQKEFVGTIHEKGEQLLQLIMSLLDMSKLESGTMSMRRRPTQVYGVLSDVVTTVTPQARKKGVIVKLEAEPLAPLRADPERLRQVFLNLVDNAVKFTPPGGTVTIRARSLTGPNAFEADGFALLAPARERLEVRVIDTGIGIPPRERSRVFDPFYQVDSSSTREYGGTGLGLSIVKRIVEAHEGTIAIESNLPQGTVFVVTLAPASGSAEGS